MRSPPDRIRLAALPSPLERADRLSAAWGGPTIWIKRDDLTGFGLSGNKVRKLEFHLAAARAKSADTVITCGAVQSNHCRTTALAAARLGLGSHLVLRTPDGLPPDSLDGNHLLQRLAGASVHFIDPAQYSHRDAVMAAEALQLEEEGRTVAIIPEGASDALGMWGVVAAMEELADQLDVLPQPPAAIWHAASSGGTSAGLGWAADRLDLDVPIVGLSVGEATSDHEIRIAAIWRQAAEATGGRFPEPDLEVIDRYVGLGYGATTDEELCLQAKASALTGLLFDPTYTGKALYGLKMEIDDGRYGPGDHVIFWHTGGGFAVFAHDFGAVLN